MSSNRYEFSNSERDAFKPQLLYLTKSVYGSDWHSTPHFHPFMEVLFVTSGSGTFVIENARCCISRGDIVIIRPNALHTEESSVVGAMEYIIVGVDNVTFDLIKEEFDESESPQLPVFAFSGHYEKVYFFLQQIYHEITEKRVNYRAMASSMLSALLIYLMRHTNLALADYSKTECLTKECAFVKQYIDAHFANSINLDELAQKTFVSKYHLIRSFTKSIGVSPIQYVMQKRLDEAKVLLTTTNHPIGTIARISGFSSAGRFAAKFKEMTGLTPHDYAKQHIS